jgi:hypothetical protein
MPYLSHPAVNCSCLVTCSNQGYRPCTTNTNNCPKMSLSTETIPVLTCLGLAAQLLPETYLRLVDHTVSADQLPVLAHRLAPMEEVVRTPDVPPRYLRLAAEALLSQGEVALDGALQIADRRSRLGDLQVRR